MIDGEIDRDAKYDEDYANSCWYQQPAPFFRACGSFERTIVHDLERCLVEVAVLVRVRIEEETLRATFHGG